MNRDIEIQVTEDPCPRSHRLRDPQPITRTSWCLGHFTVPPFLHESSDFTPHVHLEWAHPREGRTLRASSEQRWRETITALKHVGDRNRLLQVIESSLLQHRAPQPPQSPTEPLWVTASPRYHPPRLPAGTTLTALSALHTGSKFIFTETRQGQTGEEVGSRDRQAAFESHLPCIIALLLYYIRTYSLPMSASAL